MFAGMTTRFDDTIVLEEADVLAEKILLEHTTAKSSESVQTDVNARERLTFQVMQYLEVATREPDCSLTVIADGAFAARRNTYHVSLRSQVARLAAFTWFEMEHCCECSEYLAFVHRLVAWLDGRSNGEASGGRA
jgi:hypothetical protein